MLAVLQLDGLNLALVEHMIDAGDLPTLSALGERGEWRRLETPATYFTGATQPSLYTGIELGDHSQFYVHQWDAAQQRLRFRTAFETPEPAWDRVARAGRRALAIDQYEGYPPQQPGSVVVSGLQFHNYLGLERWASPESAGRRVARLIGRSRYAEEVFGKASLTGVLSLRRRLLEAPRRIADATTALLAERSFDLVWLTFLSGHIGGHQFWNLSQLDHESLDEPTKRLLSGTLRELYRDIDRQLGRVLEALPDDADTIVVSPLGMEENTSRADFLGQMLDAAISGRIESAGGATVPLWRLRATVPARTRWYVAQALGPRLAREVMARGSVAGVDWTNTKAFTLPSDHNGQIRLNLRGRERDGIVDPGEADELIGRISTGLLSFRDADGKEAVAAVDRAEDIVRPDSPYRELLPDLLVRWGDTPATRLRAVESPLFGRIERYGYGSGRSGGHTDVGWALLAPGRARLVDRGGGDSVLDVVPTVCALLDADPTGLRGTPLLEPA